MSATWEDQRLSLANLVPPVVADNQGFAQTQALLATRRALPLLTSMAVQLAY